MSDLQEAVIVDRGYRAYTEERRGRRGAMTAGVKDGVRRVLGLRRKGRRKVLPWTFVVMALGSSGILVAIHWAFRNVPGGPTDLPPTYGGYFDFISVVALLFVGLAAPQILVPDRTQGVLSIYFSRPLGVVDYLAAKGLALVALMLAFYVVPQTVLHLGLAAVSGEGFLSYLTGHLDVVWKVPLMALVYVVAHGSVAMAVASLIPRTGVAAGVYLGIMTMLNPVAELLTNLTNLPGSRYGAFLALEQLPRVVRDWLFDVETVRYIPERAGFGPMTVLGVILAVAAVSGAITYLQYRRAS